jgi:hypoxanthine phosphoribosyltransferase
VGVNVRPHPEPRPEEERNSPFSLWTRPGDAGRPTDTATDDASRTDDARPDEFVPSIAGTPAGIIERPADAPVVFAHPSERELARILDFYRIPWRYEPRSFVLRAKGDRVLEMFSPDFYLPELNQYVELTTLRQRLVTKKNRKLRLLRELYPDVNVRLLYRRDYQELLAKYGFGPAELTWAEAEAFRAEAGAEQILSSQAQIAATVRRLGETLTRDYADRPPVLVGILKGVTFFMSDLIRQIRLPVEVDYMAISTLGTDGPVRIVKDLALDIQDRHVLLVEDIVDTGMTLNYILGHLERRGPASLEVCTLLDKRARRLAPVRIRYVGFELADEFIVGYGLDFHQRYRNLPFLATLRPERYRPEPG